MKQLELEFQGPLGGSIRLSDNEIRQRIEQLPKEAHYGPVGLTSDPFYEEAFGFSRIEFRLYLEARHNRGGSNPLEGHLDWSKASGHTISEMLDEQEDRMTPELFRAFDRIAAHIKLAGWYPSSNSRTLDMSVIDRNEVTGDKEDWLLHKYRKRIEWFNHVISYRDQDEREARIKLKDAETKYNTVKGMREFRTMDYVDIATKIHEEMRETNNDTYSLPAYVSQGISTMCFFTGSIDVEEKFVQVWTAAARPDVKIPRLIHDGGKIFEMALGNERWLATREFESHAQALIDARKMTERQYSLLWDLAKVLGSYERSPFLALNFHGQKRSILEVLDKYVK